MIPILFPSTATEWTTQGLGALSDAISCTVTEERNGIFELEMQYPMSGVHFDEMQNRCIILAIPSPYRTAQPFRIYRITKPLNGICTVYAQHISYDLSGVPLNPFTAASAPAAMAGLQSNAEGASPFTFWTDKATTANFAVTVPSSTRSVLGGKAGSILDAYGGEYAWDGYTVRLYNQRGQDNGVRIAYGKNLTDLEQDENISNVATGIYPYWADTDGNLVVCNPKIVPAPGTYNFTRVVPVDFSQDFEAAPTQEQLQARAESYVQANNIGVPTVSLSVSFVQLEQTEEYKDLALLEKCDLCDTVTVQFERLGVDAKAEIVKIVTDVLLERYKSVEIGSIRANIADTIAGQQQEIQKRPTTSAMQQAVSDATNWITGANGGYVVFQRNADGQPYEILIMDQPTIAAATKVWRWNQGGLGYSSNGYNGPYTTAITQDGAIVADFITTGTLNCALLKVINLVAQGVQLTGDFTATSGDYTMQMWAAILSLFDGDNLRARIYTTSPEESIGNMQVFSGPVTESGMQAGAYVTQIQPNYIECGADQNSNCSGTIKCGDVSASKNISTSQAIKFNAVCPTDGENTLLTDWKRGNQLTADDWVLVGGQIAPY